MSELLYGRQIVLECLRAGRRQCRRLLAQDSLRPAADLDEIFALASERGLPMDRVDRRFLDQKTAQAHHQGLAIEVSGYPYVEWATLLAGLDALGEPPLLLLLDHIEDPQNLGSLLRTADAAGVHGVLVPADRAAHVTPAAVRASAGAAEHARVTLVTNLARAMRELKDHGLWFTGLEAEGEAPSEGDLTGPMGLVVGSEGHGLGRLIRETCDRIVALPLHGKVNSLNAGVAGAIALYEIRRQREAGA